MRRVLLLVTASRRRCGSRARLLGGGVVLVVMVVASTVVGSTWPGLLFHYREAPSAATLDRNEIAQNLTATKAAFGLDGDITTIPYILVRTRRATPTSCSWPKTTAQASVIDPNQLSPTFNVKQQLQAYYGFKSTLDTSHYDIDGQSQDVALAVRELQSERNPPVELGEQPSRLHAWVRRRRRADHGGGPQDQSPVFLDGGMPPRQQIPVTRPQIYFGQGFGSSSYSIVGQPAGSTRDLEFDHPGGNGSSASAYTTYQGHGGIPIGSTLRRLLFAMQMHSPNIFFSSELNSASQLLTVRNPRARVAKVAPWLTLDGDVYPAVVDGRSSGSSTATPRRRTIPTPSWSTCARPARRPWSPTAPR